MKCKIIQPFICRFSGVRYDLDDVFESDSVERIKELQEAGFLAIEESTEQKSKRKTTKSAGNLQVEE